MLKKVFLILVLALFMSVFFGNCKKSTTGPDEPVERPQYWQTVKVTYIRDPAKITLPEGNDAFTGIGYTLYDPNARANKLEYEHIDDPVHRRGGINMKKVAENKFVGYIEKVFFQTQPCHQKHMLNVRDTKLYDGFSDGSMETADGIVIEGAYDISIVSHMLYFKMSKKD